MSAEFRMTGIQAATIIARAIAREINYYRHWGEHEKEDALVQMLSAIVEQITTDGFGVFHGTKDELMEELVAIIQKEGNYEEYGT